MEKCLGDGLSFAKLRIELFELRWWLHVAVGL